MQSKLVSSLVLATVLAACGGGGGGGGTGGGKPPVGPGNPEEPGAGLVDGAREPKKETTYDGDGKLTSVLTRDGENTKTETYDPATGQLNGTAFHTESYDAASRTRTEEEYSVLAGSTERRELSKSQSVHDEQGREIESIESFGPMTKRSRKTWAENGTLAKTEWFDFSDELEKSKSCTYDDQKRPLVCEEERYLTGEIDFDEDEGESAAAAGSEKTTTTYDYAARTITIDTATKTTTKTFLFDDKITDYASDFIGSEKEVRKSTGELARELTRTCTENDGHRKCSATEKGPEDHSVTTIEAEFVLRSFTVGGKEASSWFALKNAESTSVNGVETAASTSEYEYGKGLTAPRVAITQKFGDKVMKAETLTTYDESGLNPLEMKVFFDGALKTRTVYEY